MKQLHEQLKELRESRGLSYRQLEALSNVNTASIYKMEQGDRLKTIEVINRMLEPMGAWLAIVEMPEPTKTRKQLESLVAGGSPKDYIEQRFLDEYMRTTKEEKKLQIIEKYTTSYVDVIEKEGI